MCECVCVSVCVSVSPSVCVSHHLVRADHAQHLVMLEIIRSLEIGRRQTCTDRQTHAHTNTDYIGRLCFIYIDTAMHTMKSEQHISGYHTGAGHIQAVGDSRMNMFKKSNCIVTKCFKVVLESFGQCLNLGMGQQLKQLPCSLISSIVHIGVPLGVENIQVLDNLRISL